MKLSQAENLLQSLKEFKGIKGVVAYKLAFNEHKLINELTVYLRMKDDLIRKYGEEKNGQISINTMSKNYPQFIEELAPLEEQEINVDFNLISEDELSTATDLTQAQQLFIRLNFMEK